MTTVESKDHDEASSKLSNPSAESAPLAAVLAYVAERGVATVSGQEPDSVALLLSSMAKRIDALETRNRELESKVVSLRKLSEILQDALREAQLGFRRHVRQRVSLTELQAALAFPDVSNAVAPIHTSESDANAIATSPNGNSSADTAKPTDGSNSESTQPAAEPSQPQPPSSSRPSNKNRDAHGRSKVGIIPQVFIEIVPPEVQLEGLNNFERIGVEDSPVLGYRRGGPVQIVFRRVKYVSKASSDLDSKADESPTASTADMPSQESSNPPEVATTNGCEQSTTIAEADRQEVSPSQPAPVAQTDVVGAGAGSSAARREAVSGLLTVTASDVLCVPPDPAFKRSPFVDGALIWYVPEPPDLQPDRQVLIADLPERPLVRGMADASLIAHAISHKLDFHLPYYRQQSELGRYGLPISRANLCRWHFEAGALVKPIADTMWQEALGRRWFAMDATSTAIFDKTKYRKGHVYVLVAPGDSVLFRYAPKYDGQTVQELFGGTEAIVVADACATNNPAFGPGRIRGSGCWSHARKRFVSAFELGDKKGAAPGLQFIRELFRIEDEIALLSADDRLRIRNEKSAPIVTEFYAYIEAFPELDADAPMYKAVRYTTNQKELLCRFLSNGDVPIHNNCSERALRRIVKGRANWLFMFSDEHAKHSCALVSLLASCDQHGLDPEFYLQEVLTVAPTWPMTRALELSPKYWLGTRQRLIRDGALRYIDLARISGSKLAFRPR